MKEENVDAYSEVSKSIGKIAIFGALSQDELKEIISSMTLKKYEKGDVIFKQGGSPEYINIVEQGSVKLVRDEDGEKQLVHICMEGELFGETALLGILPYAISAVAETEVFVLQMSKFAFHDLSKENPKLFSKFLLNITREICRHNYVCEKSLAKEIEEKNNCLTKLKNNV